MSDTTNEPEWPALARGNLGAGHGKIAQTGAIGHYSLWLRNRFHADAHLLFEVVA